MKRTRLIAHAVVSLAMVMALLPSTHAAAETAPPAPTTPAPASPAAPAEPAAPGEPGAAAPADPAAPASADPTASGAATPAPTASNDRGLLYVSGVSGTHQGSWNPFAGNLELSVTLRNASTAKIDATVQFSAKGPFGNQLGKMVEIPIRDLEPEETRTVSATVGPVGQWALVSGNATVIPPKQIGPTELGPMERSQSMFYVPWAVATLLALLLVGWLVARRSRRTQPRAVTTPAAQQEGATAASEVNA